ncbi:MAG TPA: hypothetical protein VLB27_07125, partial [candidate division Zixibacteria bacterium]|nr:hypothetical protein [candidate division Zixibacteria bacterium]
AAYFWVNSDPKVSGPPDTTIAVCEAGTMCFPVDVFDAEDNVTSIIATGGTNIYYNAGQVCFDPDSSGVYEIIVTATDSCGAQAADTTLVTVIENRPPSLELQDTLTIQCVDQEVCLPLNVSDADDNSDTIIVTGGRYDGVTGELCLTPAGNGEFVVVVVAVDDCGASVTDSLRVTVNNGDPFALDCPNDTAVFICEPDTLCFNVPGVPEGALVELSPPSVWYNAAQGTVCFYTNCSIRKDIRMIVTNGCYVDTCEFVVTVTMNSPPLVIAAPDIAPLLCVPQDVCVPVGISDANENLSYVVVSPDGYYNRITGRVCVPVDTGGLYHVTVTAYDSCGAKGVDSFYINATLNQPPIVTDANDTTIFLCTPAPVCLPIAVSDPDRNLLSIGVKNGVYDPKSDMVCFIPSDTGGVYTIITTAIDACGAKDADTTVATVIINSLPELTITSDTALFICEPGEVCIPVQLYDADGNIAVVTASAGAWWDEARQRVCFAAGATGSYTFETTVVDSCGAYTRKRTTVHVTVNTAPVVATSVDTTVVGCVF